jgi:hypothetical protein
MEWIRYIAGTAGWVLFWFALAAGVLGLAVEWHFFGPMLGL